MTHLDEGQLHEYLDGERAGGRTGGRADIDLHLAQCAACRARLEEERALRDRAQAILGAAGPARFTAPPFDAVLKRAAGRRASRFRPRPAVALAWAASFALAVSVGWYARGLLVGAGGTARIAGAAAEEEVRADAIQAAPPAGRQVAPAVPPPQEAARRQSPQAPGLATGAVPSAVPTSLRDRPVANVAAETAVAEAKAEQRLEPAPMRVAEAPAPLTAPAAAMRQAWELDVAEAAGLAWVSVAPAEAERRLGGPLAIIPGLPSLGTSVYGAGPSAVARTIQALGPGLTIELVQQRGAAVMERAARDRAAAPAAMPQPGRGLASEPGQSVTVQWEGFSITGRALVPADSLRKLLARLTRP